MNAFLRIFEEDDRPFEDSVQVLHMFVVGLRLGKSLARFGNAWEIKSHASQFAGALRCSLASFPCIVAAGLKLGFQLLHLSHGSNVKRAHTVSFPTGLGLKSNRGGSEFLKRAAAKQRPKFSPFAIRHLRFIRRSCLLVLPVLESSGKYRRIGIVNPTSLGCAS